MAFYMNKVGYILKKLWCCISGRGGYYKIIWSKADVSSVRASESSTESYIGVKDFFIDSFAANIQPRYFK